MLSHPGVLAAARARFRSPRGPSRAGARAPEGIAWSPAFASSLAYGLVFYFFGYAGAWVLLRDLAPGTSPLLLLGLPVIPLLGNLPIAFGGLGLREQVSAALFGQFGAGAGDRRGVLAALVPDRDAAPGPRRPRAVRAAVVARTGLRGEPSVNGSPLLRRLTSPFALVALALALRFAFVLSMGNRLLRRHRGVREPRSPAPGAGPGRDVPRAPLFPVEMALGFLIGGQGNLLAVRMLQLALAAVLGVLGIRLATRLGGRAAGVLTGLCLAFAPTLVFTTGMLYPTLLYCTLLMTAVSAAVAADDEPRRAHGAGRGRVAGARLPDRPRRARSGPRAARLARGRTAPPPRDAARARRRRAHGARRARPVRRVAQGRVRRQGRLHAEGAVRAALLAHGFDARRRPPGEAAAGRPTGRWRPARSSGTNWTSSATSRAPTCTTSVRVPALLPGDARPHPDEEPVQPRAGAHVRRDLLRARAPVLDRGPALRRVRGAEALGARSSCSRPPRSTRSSSRRRATASRRAHADHARALGTLRAVPALAARSAGEDAPRPR
ncbi:MAG: glycosyltransferase family 39 protein [Candidatus Eisenbacteria bacterium]|nr:glycosyltransferase family 39 protein [Candidatus Eisenbacteria bacterium]